MELLFFIIHAWGRDDTASLASLFPLASIRPFRPYITDYGTMITKNEKGGCEWHFIRYYPPPSKGCTVEMVHVEADVSNGLPVFHMVGYLSSEVKEASERVRTAIRNAGIQIPARKVVVNLAPATVRKKGASFDLPIALAVMAALGEIEGEKLERTLVIGELGLDGRVQEVPGILPMLLEARKAGCRACILPIRNRRKELWWMESGS